MKGLLGLLSAVIVVLLIAGCAPKTNSPPNITVQGAVISSGNTTVYVNGTEAQSQAPQENTTNTTTSTTPEPAYAMKVTGTEGDLIALKLKAVDPDGNSVTYTYSTPFNSNGLWQTKDGDAGKYLVTVTASDGMANTSADVLVVVNPSNKPPVIDCPADIYIKEGDTVNLNCSFYDKENDPISVEYSGWMNSPSYTTNYDSSGDHNVYVKASDGFSNVTKTIIVHVENVPRPPVFKTHLKDITASEGDIVTLKPDVFDPDNNPVSIKYSDPFDKNGVFKTKIGDAGTYPVTVVATDGVMSTKETFLLTVKMTNTPPVMKEIQNITVYEGDTVTIKPDVTDREGDPITVTYTGWMKSASYTTTYNDAYPNGCDKPGCDATYKVTVTASDGQYSVSQDVYVTVFDKNRPPEFVWPTQ